MKNTFLAIIITVISSFAVKAQVTTSTDFNLIPGINYEIAGITVTGAGSLDPNVVIMLTNLRVGDDIQFPDEKISDAIRTLWRQKAFENITFKVVNKVVKGLLDIQLVALPKLSKYYMTDLRRLGRTIFEKT